MRKHPLHYPCKLVGNIFTSATTERTPNLRPLRHISWTRIFQNHFFRNHIFQKHISHLPKIRSCQMHFSYIVNCISSIFVVLTDEGHLKYPSSEDLKKVITIWLIWFMFVPNSVGAPTDETRATTAILNINGLSTLSIKITKSHTFPITTYSFFLLLKFYFRKP